jgi:hypothetical protein
MLTEVVITEEEAAEAAAQIRLLLTRGTLSEKSREALTAVSVGLESSDCVIIEREYSA